jgi:hypothetical protein
MKTPFAYVLYIGHDKAEVSLHRTLDEAEEALRDFAATIVVGPADDDIPEVLAEDGVHVRLFALTMKRNKQSSVDLRPFARSAKAA